MNLLASIISLCLAFPAIATSQIFLGNVQLMPGRVVEFEFPLSQLAAIEGAKTSRLVSSGSAAIAIPQVFDLRKPNPILWVSAPTGGSSVHALQAYADSALQEGWMLLAADGPVNRPVEDTLAWRWAVLSSAFAHLHKAWPATKSWPVACSGFSGGAKMSAMLGAYLCRDNYSVIGVFMGGCNEERATLGMQIAKPGDRYKAVPMFLSSGKLDPIASPAQHKQVKLALLQAGFKQVRLESYEGGHQPDPETLKTALKWFTSLRPPASAVPTIVTTSPGPPPPRTAAQKTAADAKLLDWQRKEAEAGRASAQLSLGLRYLSGDGVEPDEQGGRSWLLKAAQQGDNEAYAKLRNTDYLEERRDPTGRVIRGTKARRDFMKTSGFPNGRPGYVITHLVQRSAGGCDCADNLKWESLADARRSETWED